MSYLVATAQAGELRDDPEAKEILDCVFDNGRVNPSTNPACVDGKSDRVSLIVEIEAECLNRDIADDDRVEQIVRYALRHCRHDNAGYVGAIRFEIANETWADTICAELLDSPESISVLQQRPWFIALRELKRRLEQSKYNEDGDPWISMPKGSHDAEACWKLNRLFPGLLKIESEA